MDYKYIEQLMERYWNAETTLEEESILRSFFRQENIPAEMEPLRALFADEATNEVLGDDFDARMLEMIREEEAPKAVKAREITLTRRLMPLFKAAAVVAIILTIGGALQAPWGLLNRDCILRLKSPIRLSSFLFCARSMISPEARIATIKVITSSPT